MLVGGVAASASGSRSNKRTNSPLPVTQKLEDFARFIRNLLKYPYGIGFDCVVLRPNRNRYGQTLDDSGGANTRTRVKVYLVGHA